MKNLSIADILSIVVTILLAVIGFILERKARKIQEIMTWKEFREPLISFANETIDTLSQIEGLCEIDPTPSQQEFWNKLNELLFKISALRDKGKLLIPNNNPERFGQHQPSAYQGIRQKSLDCLAAAFHITTAINFEQRGYNLIPGDIDADDANLDQAERKIRMGLLKLPKKVNLAGITIKGNFVKGWSCKQSIVETKRQFVSEIQDLIDTRTWIISIKKIPTFIKK